MLLGRDCSRERAYMFTFGSYAIAMDPIDKGGHKYPAVYFGPAYSHDGLVQQRAACMYDLDKKVWKVARSFTVMEDRFPFRGSVGIGKQIDLTRVDDGLTRVDDDGGMVEDDEEIPELVDSSDDETDEESDDDVVEVIPERREESEIVRMKEEDDENKSAHISVNATPPGQHPPPITVNNPPTRAAKR